MKKTINLFFIIALIVVIATFLFACVPSNIEKATSKMQEAGYKVSTVSHESYEGCIGSFTAVKISISEGSGTMFAFYFEDNASAKEAYNNMVDKEEESDIKLKGKWVYYGSSAAIEAFEA